MWSAVDSLGQDLRHACRGMRRSPVFTAVAIVTLALGIGANAAVFTVTNAVLFKGFPLVHENHRILYVTSGGPGYGPFVSYPDFEDWRAQAQSFEGMGLVNAVRMIVSDGGGFPETCNGTQVSANAFTLLGQRPVVGRDFAPSDETPGAPPVAILNDAFWERRWGRDPAIIGRSVRINGTPTTVIGVMAPGFSFPRAQDLWTPLVPTAALQDREARSLWFAFGRMAEGVTVETVRAEMETIGRGLASAYPQTNRGLRPAVQTFRELFTGANATTMYVSMVGAVGCVLLIACANLANLSLARALGRTREISVRIALGAGKGRIIRQLLIESVMLSTIGGVLGWVIAQWSVRAYELTARSPGWFDRIFDYSMDTRVFAYLAAMSIGTGLLFGLAPSLRLAKLDVNTALNEAGRRATGGGRGKYLSALLVTGEVALALVLLAGAGTMIHGFVNIYTAHLGVETDNILTTFLELPDAAYPRPEARIAFYDRLETRLAAVPGVESVALADSLPTQGVRRLHYERAGLAEDQRRPGLSALVVSPGYFQTLGVTVVSGREFNAFDRASGAPVAIVNQRLATEHWPGEDPLGKRLRLLDGTTPDTWLTIVGVVPNIVQNDVTRQRFDPLLYLPYRQQPATGMWVLARAHVAPGGLAAAFRREVQALDSDLPMFDSMTLAQRVAEGYRSYESFGGLFLAFAAMALLLASLGLYAVVAHAVSQRTQEIGIRTAMGATASDILELVFRQGMLPVGLGLTIGLAAALALMPVLKSQLVQVSPADPLTLLAASATLIVFAMLACVIPARRALRVDPAVALRQH